MRIIESRSIDNQAGLLGSRLITGTNAIEGAFQSFIVAEDTVVTKVYNSIGIDVTSKLGLTSITLKAGAFISMPKGDYFSSIKLASGSIVAYFTSHGGQTITADAYLNEFLARVGSSYLEASECVKAHLQQLINIGLLQKASLIMSPSMYEEDLVKSVVPQDGSGDLSFTRASNGTRINSAGLVEVCPWNLFEFSEQFDSAAWAAANATIVANDAVAPNGTTTADKFTTTSTTTESQVRTASFSILSNVGIPFTTSVYAKKGTANFLRIRNLFSSVTVVERNGWFNLNTGTLGTIDSGQTGTITDVGNGWYRCTLTGLVGASGNANLVDIGFTNTDNTYFPTTSVNGYLWGAQLNIGSTAKPYFPTTDRLNVPRLTYQNGGGGCPSLLLEKQSTNEALYSNTLETAAWGSVASGTACSITTNDTTSPDGTQNASKITYNTAVTGSGTYSLWRFTKATSSNGTYSISVWLKAGTITKTYIRFSDSGGNRANLECNLTSQWQRFTLTGTTASSISTIAFDIGADGNGGQTQTSGYLYAYGAQLEASSYPTSYIPTTSSSATRVADECRKGSISSLIGQTEGSLYGEMLANPSGESLLMWVRNSTAGLYGNFIYLGTNSNGEARLQVVNSAIVQAEIVGSGALSIGWHKFAVGYKLNDFVFYVDGVQIGTASSGSVPSNMNELFLDQYIDGGIRNASKKEVVLFPTRLTNTQLAQLTA